MPDGTDATAPYRFPELGALEFERLCFELLASQAGLTTGEWRDVALGRAVVFDQPVALGGYPPPPPTLVLVTWMRDWLREAHYSSGRVLKLPVAEACAAWPSSGIKSVVVLTNGPADAIEPAEGLETTVFGASELTLLVRAAPRVRLRRPSVLGVSRLGELVNSEVRERSTMDFEGAATLARVFVPTGAYARALTALENHHFAFLTGPPEMGKTAIARMVGLGLMTIGWEMHECIRPEQLWERYARERPQVFVADDAFGSTEYRPDAAERWALELDRALRAMDESHWLLWTSRPAPLKAALRRIHREHGVERFPAPAEVQVDAAWLDVAEKALILFRHAKAAGLPKEATRLIQSLGWRIVSHPHFTPERIRRFVSTRLERAQAGAIDLTLVDEIVTTEIREPTLAMAESFGALAPEHRAVLVAMLDVPPGPVSERQFIAAVRRHNPAFKTQEPTELLDRLTDHFLRIVEPASITWVHPSWRDLVIEELVANADARRSFLRDCSLEGLLLALSTAGGKEGERALPLLIEDADWDLAGDRVSSLMDRLDDPAIARFLTALREARPLAARRQSAELEALALYALDLVARRWDRERSMIPVGVLAVWFELATELPRAPQAPDVAPTWVELVPTERVDLSDSAQLARLDDWAALATSLRECRPQALGAFEFPQRQADIITAFVADARAFAEKGALPPFPDLTVALLRALRDLTPANASGARQAAQRLSNMAAPSGLAPTNLAPRQISRELREFLEAPAATPRSDERLVARVLRDL